MAILTTAQYPEIRAAIGVEVNSRVLPDKVISMSIYLGAAERWALTVDADAATREGDELITLKSAITLKTASLLIKAMPMLLREEFRLGEGFQRQKVDVKERADDLAAQALDAINSYIEPTEDERTAVLPVFFDVASGTRGK